MDRPATETAACPARRDLPAWAWLPALGALFAWQAWLTLGLFGPDPLTALRDDRFIESGLHPQHLYLGTLGARALAARGSSCAYDHAFLAGYPKTPIFDGSRLAEVFILVGGGGYQPASYKIGLACCCMLVPLLLLLAARGAGLDRVAALLVLFVGQLVWWGPLGRGALEAGDYTLYLAALAGLAHVGMILQFHRAPGVASWLGVWLTACLGWFLQPLFFPIAQPLLLAYYLSVGARHDFLTWHSAFWLAECGAIAVNLYWLTDWAGYWWLRSPLPTTTVLLPHRTLATIWNAPLWGGEADRVLALALFALAAVGVVVMNQTGRRPAARLLGLGAGGGLILALLGISWEPLGLVGTAALFAPALWFAALPAADVATGLVRQLCRGGACGRLASLALVAAPALALAAAPDLALALLGRCVETRPLTLGLSPHRQTFLQELVRRTSPDARILWEDRTLAREASRWPALLPLLTGRQFVGGLDPDGFIEHSTICLTSQGLEGRPLSSWSDEELADYCRLYNIGWILTWTPIATQRFEAWNGAARDALLLDETEATLFRIARPRLGFTLRGKAEVLHADSRYILLGDVIPENGAVVMSFHYQAGMRASPGRVLVERESNGDDPVGFVRLRLAAPAARVTLSWDR